MRLQQASMVSASGDVLAQCSGPHPVCFPAAKPGAVAVRALVVDRYGPTDFPIFRAFRRVMDSFG